MLVVVVPLVAIITMNAGIGVKICRYTGRTKPASSSTSQIDSVDEIFSNCSTIQKYHMTVRGRLHGHNNGVATATAAGAAAGGAGAAGAVRGPSTPPQPTPPPPPPTVSVVTSGMRQWRILTRKQHTQVRITRALLIVSTVFIALNLPSYAFRIHAFVISVRNEAYSFSTHAFIWQEFIQFLYYSNFSSRFFLYSACSRNFRYALNRLACRRKRGPN